MRVIVFLGYGNAGKTTSIVRVASQLVKVGKKVGTLKHIHDEGFTIDTMGKDTWRHASAGASPVIALAPNELTIIEKVDTRELALDDLFGIFRSRHVDYLLIEGLYNKLSRRKDVMRILCVKTPEEADELLAMHPEPSCILTRKEGRLTSIQGVPVLKLPRDLRKLMKLVRGAGA